MSKPESTFWASSSYGNVSRLPIVSLHHQDWMIQVSPEVARTIAQSIVEAAEAAEQDAFLFEWVKTECGATEEGAVRLLREFRAWRKAQADKKG